MKRILCALLAMLLLIPAAFAEEIDLSGMSVDELKTLRSRIDAELLNRNPQIDGDVIRDDSYLLFIVKSCEITDKGREKEIIFDCEWTNRRDKAESLNGLVSISAKADGETIVLWPHQTGRGMSQKIKANTSYAFKYTIIVPDWASTVEVKFSSYWTSSDVYKTYTFNLE